MYRKEYRYAFNHIAGISRHGAALPDDRGSNVFYAVPRMAGFFPPDVQEALQPRLDAIDKQPKSPRIFGGVLVGILCLLFVCLYLCGGIDGLHHQFAFRDFLLRFLVISFGIKAFDIIALDYFLLTKRSAGYEAGQTSF